MEFDKLLAVLRAFHDEGVEYAPVGGAALSLLGLVRATVAADFFVRPDGENVERIRRALRRVWNDSDIDGIVVDDLAGEYAVVRYGPPDETIVVDLIARVGDAFTFDDLEWNAIDVEGVPPGSPPGPAASHPRGLVPRTAVRAARRRDAAFAATDRSGTKPHGRIDRAQPVRLQ